MYLLTATPFSLTLAPNSKKFSELLATHFPIFKNNNKNEVADWGTSSPPIAIKKMQEFSFFKVSLKSNFNLPTLKLFTLR